MDLYLNLVVDEISLKQSLNSIDVRVFYNANNFQFSRFQIYIRVHHILCSCFCLGFFPFFCGTLLITMSITTVGSRTTPLRDCHGVKRHFIHPLIPFDASSSTVIRAALSPALLINLRSLDLQALLWVGRASTGSMGRRVRLSTMPHTRVLRGRRTTTTSERVIFSTFAWWV